MHSNLPIEFPVVTIMYRLCSNGFNVCSVTKVSDVSVEGYVGFEVTGDLVGVGFVVVSEVFLVPVDFEFSIGVLFTVGFWVP